MKPRDILRVVVCLCFLIATFEAFKTTYYLRHFLDDDVNVLQNEKEAFIFIGKGCEGSVGSRVWLLYEGFLGIWGTTLTDHKANLFLVHIHDGKQETFDLKNFAYGGGAFVLHGDIYWGCGSISPEEPPVWKWNGTNFDRLSASDAHKVRGSFTLDSEIIAKEGWQEKQGFLKQGETSITVPLNTLDYKVILRQGASNGKMAMAVLLQSGVNNEPQTLLAESDAYEYESVDRKTYRQYFDHKTE